MKDKKQESEIEIAVLLEYANGIIATLREPFLVLDKDLQVISANRVFYTTFEVKEEDIIGRPLPDLGDRQWNIPKLLQLLKEIIPEKKVVKDYGVEHKFEQIGQRAMILNACQLCVPKKIAAIIAAGVRREEEERVLHRYFQKIIEEGVAYNIGLTFVTKDGKKVPINFSGALMQQDGKIVGIVGVARDMRQIMAIISDLENKEIELEKRNKNFIRMQRAMLHIMDDLQEASRAKTQFTEMVSHELRTPLAAIKEGVSVILDKIAGSINEEQQKYLDVAKKNVDRLDRLISAVLDFQKLESGKMEFKIEENDLNEVVKEIQETMYLVAEKKNLDFACQLDKGLPRVKFDRDKITQVLTNLVDNALKFTEKGSITITTGKRDNFIQVVVKDTGPGIKEEDIPKLFQQFRQLQRKMGGTGLGLSICKQIIEAHKGKIWAESPPAGAAGKFSKGTAFYFTIPEKFQDKKKIGKILIEKGKINEEDLKKALEEQEKQE